jgi:hypothetical protein
MQFCEKQGFQAINIPAYSQNSSVLSVQSHNLPMRIIPNVYVPQSDNNHEKNDVNLVKNGNDETNCSTVSFNLSIKKIYYGFIYKSIFCIFCVIMCN